MDRQSRRPLDHLRHPPHHLLDRPKRLQPDPSVQDQGVLAIPFDPEQRQIRMTVPIIILSAKAEEIDRIVGLELGADDYLAKPFSPRELVLRVQAILRSVADNLRPAHRDVLTLAGIEICRSRLEVKAGGRLIPLTATEYKLLVLLAERRGRLQNRDTLLNEVWGYEALIETRTVDTHIRRLLRGLIAVSNWCRTASMRCIRLGVRSLLEIPIFGKMQSTYLKGNPSIELPEYGSYEFGLISDRGRKAEYLRFVQAFPWDRKRYAQLLGCPPGHDRDLCSEAAEQFGGEATEWISLARVLSSYQSGLVIGDFNVLHYLIREADLSLLDFTKTFCQTDSA